MPLVPQPLLVLHGDLSFRARVRRAIPTGLHLAEVPGWPALRMAALSAAPGAIAIVNPYEGRAHAGPSSALARLLRDFPCLPVVGAARFTPEHRGDALMLGAWGVVELTDTGAEATRARLRQTLRATRAGYFTRVLAAILPPGLSSQARGLTEEALHVAAASGLADDWARAQGISSRTLLRNCGVAGLPAPRRLLAWMRVLLAADLLNSPAHSLATVAVACGYAADMPLRRAIRSLTGVEAPALIQEGGLRTAAERFAAELAAVRSPAPEQ